MAKVTTISFLPLYFEPDRSRGERLDVGLVVIDQGGIRLRLADNLQKVRALVPGYDLRVLQSLVRATEDALSRLPDEANRLALLSTGFGPLRAGEQGGELFLMEGDDLESSLSELLSFMSESATRARVSRS